MKTKYFINNQFVFTDEIVSMYKIHYGYKIPAIEILYLQGAIQRIVFSSEKDRDYTFDYIMKIAKQSANEIQCNTI